MTSAAPPTIHLVCGLVAAGKTTFAKRLAEELPAVRLSRDEWMIRLHGVAYDDPAYAQLLAPCNELLWDLALEVLRIGGSVILDWNFWSRALRADALRRSREAGTALQLHWVDVPLDTAVQQARSRLISPTPGAHQVDDAGVGHSAVIFEPPTESEGLPVIRHGAGPHPTRD